MNNTQDNHHWPKDSAGRLLTTSVPVVSSVSSVEEVERIIKNESINFQTINYVYLANDKNKLIGVISLKELFNLPKSTHLNTFVKEDMVVVRPHTDQERIAHLAIKHGIKAVPVVNSEGVFLGVVPSDIILEVLHNEHTEDVLKLAGVRHRHHRVKDVLLEKSAFSQVRRRLPWLVLGLFGGLLAAMVVGAFETVLENELILAAFIPAIVYMADAVGSQTQMLFIRALSIEHNLEIKSYLRREVITNAWLGLVLGALIFLLSFLWLDNLEVSYILATSIFLTVCFTVLVAIFMPWYFYKRGFDPAIASGPIATVVRDVLSLCIYLMVATTFLV